MENSFVTKHYEKYLRIVLYTNKLTLSIIFNLLILLQDLLGIGEYRPGATSQFH